MWRLQSIADIIHSWVLDNQDCKQRFKQLYRASIDLNDFRDKFKEHIKELLIASLSEKDGYSANYTAEDLTEFATNWFFAENPEQIVEFYNKYYGESSDKGKEFRQYQQQLNKAAKELKHKKFEKIDECRERISELENIVGILKRNIEHIVSMSSINPAIEANNTLIINSLS